ncbi:MAG TPA: alanine dehydrogenase [Candidatus Eisenbacteria bacterium]|uniref:Alanine dehydrogenase n=1 Tax=Eiseniibacteriota bacterium TaxID=2212470 RepID=A0A7V2AWF4_UNCEI|nr:alanine dehydrogenase [Candidatus Eisenbacteria bacterium]
MIIGVPKEIKKDEYRVALLPVGAETLKKHGHKVLVEKNAGVGSGFADAEYRKAGATIVSSAKEIFRRSDMIIKVKEPQPVEIRMIREDQVVFTYFHFAASRPLTEGMIRSKAIAIAYETMVGDDGTLPLLTPMSEVAGRMAVQEGAKYLERPMEGQGILLGGVPGVAPANVVIIGGGVVGINAAKMAAGLGARVTILDVDLDRLRYLSDVLPANVTPLMSNAENLRMMVAGADLLIGAVLIKGAKAPRLVTRKMIGTMKKGAVIVDVAVDQGGCIETIKPTTHTNPTYIISGVVHYAVANMPGAVARTSTYALTNATLPYAIEIANKGYVKAARGNRTIWTGVNVLKGKVTDAAVARAFRMKYTPLETVISR